MAYVNSLAKINEEEKTDTTPEDEENGESKYQELVDFQKVDLPAKGDYDTVYTTSRDNDYDHVEFNDLNFPTRPRTPINIEPLEPLEPRKRFALQHVILVVILVLAFIAMIVIIGLLASQLVNDNDEQKKKINTLQKKLSDQGKTISFLHGKLNKSYVAEIDKLHGRITSMAKNQSKVWDVISTIQCGICIRRTTTTNPRGYYCDCRQLRPKKDCLEFYQQEYRISGLYQIHQNHRKTIQVYCDQTTNGGGWTVIQRRLNGATDFNQTWINYKNGFGSLTEEFWLGNQNIFTLTLQGATELRVELEDWDGVTAFASYGSFKLADSDQSYKLTVGEYSGTAGDDLKYNNDNPFSTRDKDNDVHDTTNCALYHKGGWWYKRCTFASLNGQYYKGGVTNVQNGILWNKFKDKSYSLKRTEMKLRRRVL